MALEGDINMQNCRNIDFKNHSDGRGDLVAIEHPKDLPFEIKRVYYIYNVNAETPRGFHSHKDLEQVLLAVNGEIKIRLKTPNEEEIVQLSDPSKGLYVGPMVWREMFDFSDHAVLLVLASHEYDENDYLRNYDDYEKEYAKVYKREVK